MSDNKAIYGYCEVCKMERIYRDTQLAPDNICVSCFGLELAEENKCDTEVSIRELWQGESGDK